MHICLRRALCDEETTVDLFGRAAEEFSNQHYDYFKSVRTRRSDPSFASGLDFNRRIAIEEDGGGGFWQIVVYAG